MEEVILRAFRFKEEGEIATEVMLLQMNDNTLSVEDAKKKVNITESFTVKARPLELANKHRCIEFTKGETKFVVHSRDIKFLLEDQGFEVIDRR